MDRSLLRRRFGRAGLAFTAAAAVIGALVLPAGAGISAADPYDCKAGAAILVPGTFDPDGWGLVGVAQRYEGKKPIRDAEGKTIIVDDPGSPYYGDGQYKVLRVTYPTTLWPAGSPGYDEDVALGAAATEYQVAEYQKNCPGRPVMIAGYSQGARVAGDVLSDIGNGRTKPVMVDGEEVIISAENVRGELYSDPRRDGPESGRGIELAIIGLLPGLVMSGARDGGFGSVPVTQYCREGDLVCDLPDLLHDPFGFIDGLVGYFNKHNYYPTRMFADVNSDVWQCDTTAVNGYIDCVVPAPSAITMVRQQIVDQLRTVLMLDPREVTDVWGMLPDLNGIFPHADLGDLQKFISPVLGLAPQWPNLGYGGYLPDLFMITDVFGALTSLDGQALVDGIKVLGGSALSIALMPVRFVEHWAGELAKVVVPQETAPQETAAVPEVLAADVLGAGVVPEQEPESVVVSGPQTTATSVAPGTDTLGNQPAPSPAPEFTPEPGSAPEPEPAPESESAPESEPAPEKQTSSPAVEPSAGESAMAG